MYCDVPGSPCLSKTGSVYGPFFLTDQRITGPVSCRCLEPGWFVGDPTPLARESIMYYQQSSHCQGPKIVSGKGYVGASEF